nr:MAG TPA: hypothetical protein [Caudoviricetes sp.]
MINEKADGVGVLLPSPSAFSSCLLCLYCLHLLRSHDSKFRVSSMSRFLLSKLNTFGFAVLTVSVYLLRT